MLPGDNRFTEVFQLYCGRSKRHHSHQILAPSHVLNAASAHPSPTWPVRSSRGPRGAICKSSSATRVTCPVPPVRRRPARQLGA